MGLRCRPKRDRNRKNAMATAPIPIPYTKGRLFLSIFIFLRGPYPLEGVPPSARSVRTLRDTGHWPTFKFIKGNRDAIALSKQILVQKNLRKPPRPIVGNRPWGR